MPSEPEVGWRFLRSARWLGYAAMLVVFAIACVLLGNWQFERRAEARAEIARIDANYDAAPVALADELPDSAAFDEDRQKWRTVRVEGEYVGAPFLARNRPGDSSVGSDLIQAMRTSDGRIFFVDRGWVPIQVGAAADEGIAAEELPEPATGPVEAEVRLRASEPAISGRSSSGRSVASIDLPELARLVAGEEWAAEARSATGSLDIVTGAYGMLVSEEPAGEHGVLPPKPERDEGPHLSYALQWYVFIVIAVIGVGYAARREYRGFNGDSESVRAQDRRSAERRRRRGRSDAEEEDALLDAR
ncbi:SURF1 family protein [Leucobacter allii]|uniref:SURF1 family cytochrome oxidase biogenesis protein n=1 Tax=Leucobacter allii TaxID=2932247 RepID=UPI001FD083A9|nr:SURF1 family protein [Leucobacter allii]UOR03067.1 SURF1 family protein [Leucobacter allii]